MTHRPSRDRTLPVFSVLLASSYAPPAAHEWDGAGTVSAADDMDAAYQLSHHVGLPLTAWVRGPDGRAHRIHVAAQGSGGVGR